MRRWQALLSLIALGLLGSIRARAQCPAFGYDSGCGTVITVTATNGVQIVQTGQGPYEGSDDTLVCIVNNSNVPIKSIVLTSPNNIFGFDGDGIDTYGAPGNANPWFESELVGPDERAGVMFPSDLAHRIAAQHLSDGSETRSDIQVHKATVNLGDRCTVIPAQTHIDG